MITNQALTFTSLLKYRSFNFKIVIIFKVKGVKEDLKLKS